jgi:hypothetical protein
MSEFRRKQQEERKRLDKAKTKWHSEKVSRAAELMKPEVKKWSGLGIGQPAAGSGGADS